MNCRRTSIKIPRTAQLLLTALCLLAAAEAAAAQNRNTISGFVFTSDRRPVPNTYVELSNEVYQILKRTRTDGSGRYFFGGLSSGRFFVKVLPLGTDLEEQTQDVEIVSIPRPGGATSDQAQKDFYLKARRSGPEVKPVAGTIFAQEVPEEARKLYEKAVDDLENDRTESGTRSLLASLKVFPEYYLALDRLGLEYIRQENYEYARAVFIKMVSVNDRSFTGWYRLGLAAYALKEPTVAVEAARKAVTLEQGSPEAHLLLGISQRLAKNFPDAEKALLKANELYKGNSADVHWNLALLYGNNMHKFAEAARELESYLRANPNARNSAEVRKLIDRFNEKAKLLPQ